MPEFSVVEEIPREAHDVRVGEVVIVKSEE
jgi:5-formyltetrahydrofolate cyclo-ligase